MKRQNKYNKKNTMQICLRLNKKTDADIIEYIELLKKNNISVNGTIRMIFRRVIIRTAEQPYDNSWEVSNYIRECRKIVEKYVMVEKYGGEKGEGDK